jgi:hypothetical protein
LRERRDATVIVASHEHADAPYAVALPRPRRERPRRRAAEEGDELAALHSITSSAMASSIGGMSSPIAPGGLEIKD